MTTHTTIAGFRPAQVAGLTRSGISPAVKRCDREPHSHAYWSAVIGPRRRLIWGDTHQVNRLVWSFLNSLTAWGDWTIDRRRGGLVTSGGKFFPARDDRFREWLTDHLRAFAEMERAIGGPGFAELYQRDPRTFYGRNTYRVTAGVVRVVRAEFIRVLTAAVRPQAVRA